MSWQEEFDKLIPEDTDILHDLVSDKILCSRQAIVNFISELLLREREEAFKIGYNYARKEIKQWAEDKVGENHEKLLLELLEELK